MRLTDVPEAIPIRTQSQAPAPVQREQPQPTVDRVTSDRASKAAEVARAAAAGVSAGHSARLAEIASAIKAGTYQPNPQAIADEILNDAEVTARLQAMLRG